MRVIDKSCCAIAAALVLAVAGTALAAGQDESAQKGKISVLLEEGYASPRLELGEVSLPAYGEFELTITGNARFADAEQADATRVSVVLDGVFVLPSIKPAFIHDESFVGGAGVPRIRIATLPGGGIERLTSVLASSPGALLQVGRHHAVVDESRVQAGSAGVVIDVNPGLGATTQREELCVRVPWGPGWANWHFTPTSGFSVKPECCTNLVWASGSGQACDGVYRNTWGCGVAIKVPDSCTGEFYTNNTYSCCCNATMAALGHVCQQVNPGSIGWVNCPL